MPINQPPSPFVPSTAAPDGLPVLEAGAHRDARSGSCVMEYVSVLAGERFTDRPRCTHPAVAALAWQVNDAVTHEARQQLGVRAVDLVGAGRDHDGPVRPVVLAAVARAGLRLDPTNRFFTRLARRVEEARAKASQRHAQGHDVGDGSGGRIATLLHVGPVNHACAHLLVAARTAGLDTATRDEVLVELLDDCLASVRAEDPVSSASVPARA
jgi:hypothetical protein